MIDWKGATTVAVADSMRARLGVTKAKGPVETDKQLEIWCRVVLMRFDPKELNEQNLAAIARHVDPKGDLGPSLQALQALALFGEAAGKQVDAVVRALPTGDDVRIHALNFLAKVQLIDGITRTLTCPVVHL